MQLSTLNNQTMSSREIADLCNARHNDVMVTIERFFDKGLLRESRKTLREYKPANGRPTKVYDLSKIDSLKIVSGYNDEIRSKIIDRWAELEKKELEIKQHTQARLESKFECKALGQAILDDHDEIKPYHFSNELDLINRIALGMTASKYRSYHDIPKNEAIRDYMSTYQLECIADLQQANKTYIEDGHEFQDRKSMLKNRFDKRHKQKLIDEIYRLEA